MSSPSPLPTSSTSPLESTESRAPPATAAPGGGGMQVRRVFNTSYMDMLTILSKVFPDEKAVVDEARITQALFTAKKNTNALHKEFETHVTKEIVDAIMDEDPGCLGKPSGGFMTRCNFKVLYTRLADDDERRVFWQNLQTCVRYSSMLRACGSNMGDLEDMATSFMSNNKGLTPAQYQAKLMQEMLGGGEMSKKLMNVFSDPNMISNIIQNVGPLIATKNGPQEGAKLNEMLKNIKIDQEDVDAMKKELNEKINQKN